MCSTFRSSSFHPNSCLCCTRFKCFYTLRKLLHAHHVSAEESISGHNVSHDLFQKLVHLEGQLRSYGYQSEIIAGVHHRVFPEGQRCQRQRSHCDISKGTSRDMHIIDIQRRHADVRHLVCSVMQMSFFLVSFSVISL